MPAPHLVNGLHQLLENLQSPSDAVHSGLEGVVCGETELIASDEDCVAYCGFDVEQLCDEGSFESVMWLLLNEQRPDGERLSDACAVLSESAVIDQPVADMISTVPLQTRPLDLLPLSIQLLSCFDPTPGDRTMAASRSQFWRVMAQLPVLLHVSFGGQLTDGRAFESEDVRSLSYAGRLLQILRDDDTLPTPIEEHAMNVVMICQCLTEMRAACFSARFFGSAVNDIVASLKSASSMFVAQLRNDPFLWTAELLKSFDSPDNAENWWDSRKSPTMPFGFSDESEERRSGILRHQCRELLGSVPSLVLESAAARLESRLAGLGQFPTVDWPATRLLALLNVPDDRISLAIGISRMVGWAAQAIEQHKSGIRLLPRLRYVNAAGISPEMPPCG